MAIGGNDRDAIMPTAHAADVDSGEGELASGDRCVALLANALDRARVQPPTPAPELTS